MTFALTASKPLEVEGFEAGAVATHTPRGDGNLSSYFFLSLLLMSQPIPREGTETLYKLRCFKYAVSRNPYPARGRKQGCFKVF